MFFTIKILKNSFSFKKKELIFYLIFYILIIYIFGIDLLIYLIVFDLYFFIFQKYFKLSQEKSSKLRNTISSNRSFNQKPKINLEFITEGKYSENEENLSKLVNEYTNKLL
tara:strand:- start:462 stop:794 length:333 start_codon:yes stop_codon:yes gene_type:complete